MMFVVTRCWRIPSDEVVVNAMGLNNEGAEAIAEKLRSLKVLGKRGEFHKGPNFRTYCGLFVWKSGSYHVLLDGTMVEIWCFLMKHGESQATKWMFNGGFGDLSRTNLGRR